MPSRRNLAALKEKLRRIRTICEFAEAFLGSMFPTAGRGIPAGRAEPLYCGTAWAMRLLCSGPFGAEKGKKESPPHGRADKRRSEDNHTEHR